MSSLIKNNSKFNLTPERLSIILESLKDKLHGRVSYAYIFGSASTGNIVSESDIDLILVKENVDNSFVKRAFEFTDLFEVYPNLDILVYTKKELEDQLADSALGFWKSVRESMRRII